MEKILDPVFNNFQKNVVYNSLGDSSIYYYDLFVEAIKSNDQRKKFPNTGDVFKKEYAKFLYKINTYHFVSDMAGKCA